MDKLEERIPDDFDHSICSGKMGEWITYCLYYKVSGCPETCKYSREQNEKWRNECLEHRHNC